METSETDTERPMSLATSILNAIASFGSNLFQGKLHEVDLPSDTDSDENSSAPENETRVASDDDDDACTIIADSDDAPTIIDFHDAKHYFGTSDKRDQMLIYTGNPEFKEHDFTAIGISSKDLPVGTILRNARKNRPVVVTRDTCKHQYVGTYIVVRGDVPTVRAEKCFIEAGDRGGKAKPLTVIAKHCLMYGDNAPIVFSASSKDIVFYARCDSKITFTPHRSGMRARRICGVQLKSNGVRELHRMRLSENDNTFCESMLIGTQPRNARTIYKNDC